MTKERIIVGDWIGSLYRADGGRIEWKLSIDSDGSYVRTVADDIDDPTTDHGQWTHDRESDVIKLEGTDADSSSWCILDVTNGERANTLLVLRRLAVASRNLPITLYRIHLKPDERITWHGRRAESPSL